VLEIQENRYHQRLTHCNYPDYCKYEWNEFGTISTVTILVNHNAEFSC
jgi:hypothetical protein